MENIFFKCILTKKIIVQSKYLNENINQYIFEHLKNKVEGICINEGYIKPDSIVILKKSIGMLLGSKFTGDITYNIAYTADVCNPVIGNVLECKVKFINKLGILGNNGPITIIVGKQFHTNDESLSHIKENDIIKVEVIAKKFSLNDKEIKIIAKLYNENDKFESKKMKKDLVSSDLTPIIADNDFIEKEDNNVFDYNSDEKDEFSVEDEFEENDFEDEFIDSDEEELKVENPDLDAEDIELNDEDDYEEEEDDDSVIKDD